MGVWGDELRRHRVKAGWSQPELAERMRYDASVISRLETGAIAPGRAHAEAADRAFDTPGTFVAWLDFMANAVYEPWRRGLRDMEQSATILEMWEPCYVPGLLQTEPYMHAIFLAGQPSETEEQIQQRVDERLARQEIWQRQDPPPPFLHAVVWEPALRVLVGGPDVMRAQLRHLAKEAVDNPRVRVQVMPLSRGANPGLLGSFEIFSFADERQRPAALIENALSGYVTEQRAETARLALHFSTMTADALDAAASAELIERMASECGT